VDTPELKRLAEMVARGLPSVQLVVNNLHVSPDPGSADDAPAASVAGAGGAAPREATPEHAALARATGLVRLEPDTGTPAWTRYAAYDRSGRQAATVYLVPAATLVREGVGDLPADHRVGRLAIYPDPAAGRYYVVLWRPDDATARPDR
jgi:hypothetical protein